MVGADEMYANTQHTFHNDILHVSYLRLLDITRNLFSWCKVCCVLACPNSPLDLPCGSSQELDFFCVSNFSITKFWKPYVVLFSAQGSDGPTNICSSELLVCSSMSYHALNYVLLTMVICIPYHKGLNEYNLIDGIFLNDPIASNFWFLGNWCLSNETTPTVTILIQFWIFFS